MSIYHNGQKVAGYMSGQNSAIISNIPLLMDGFIEQSDGTFLYTLENSLVLDTSVVDVYYDSDSQTIGREFFVSSEAGKIYFKAQTKPTQTIVVKNIRVINPSQDDSYDIDVVSGLTGVQTPEFEDYSNALVADDDNNYSIVDDILPGDLSDENTTNTFAPSLKKIVSKSPLSVILDGIKGSLLLLVDCINYVFDFISTQGEYIGQLNEKVDNHISDFNSLKKNVDSNTTNINNLSSGIHSNAVLVKDVATLIAKVQNAASKMYYDKGVCTLWFSTTRDFTLTGNVSPSTATASGAAATGFIILRIQKENPSPSSSATTSGWYHVYTVVMFNENREVIIGQSSAAMSTASFPETALITVKFKWTVK